MNISKRQVPVYTLELTEDELMWLANILNKFNTISERTLSQICSNIDKEKLEALILKLELELD